MPAAIPRQAHVDVPPPPRARSGRALPASAEPSANIPNTREKPSRAAQQNADLAEPALPANAKAIATEIGLASWYGPPYHNRRGSNGEVYNMHAMTAAHRTYPLGSIVRVTNVKTGPSALVRITDRGPFIPGTRHRSLAGCGAQRLDVKKAGRG